MLEKENLFLKSYTPPCMTRKFKQTEYSLGLSNGGYCENYEQRIQQIIREPEQLLPVRENCTEQKNGYTTTTMSSPQFKLENGVKSTESSNARHEEKILDWCDSIDQLMKKTEQSLNEKKSLQEITALSSETKCRNLRCIPSYDNVNFWSPSRTEVADDMLNDANCVTNKKPRALLFNIREHLANYQESNGTPSTEYPFTDLVRIMGQATGRSLVALLYVVINIAPIAEIFLYILRFILDKLINIKNTSDVRQMMIKYAIFAIQLLSIYVCLTFIFGFIVLPIVYMVLHIVAKIISYN
ncbi:hypothetical protein KPH14_012436 [Odynerus spinipes]|uniref:Uncharacterized protein n=1 Tax=Odynerus spinipes TaxID=1348599 RepID=A0AAD9RIN3_9HYME|nr:hypothetical protein KPH14_012436 [Odynerus spinipes]